MQRVAENDPHAGICAEAVGGPDSFDCVFAVRKYDQSGGSSTLLLADKAPDLGHLRFPVGHVAILPGPPLVSLASANATVFHNTGNEEKAGWYSEAFELAYASLGDRLGVYAVLGRSFKTTNCLESVNALVEERCAKVDHWKNSSQRHRWLATALVDIEPRLRKVVGYRHLPKLREALRRELKLEKKTSGTSKRKAA